MQADRVGQSTDFLKALKQRGSQSARIHPFSPHVDPHALPYWEVPTQLPPLPPLPPICRHPKVYPPANLSPRFFRPSPNHLPIWYHYYAESRTKKITGHN